MYNKLKAALRVPFRLAGVDRVDDTLARGALREAIVNALCNANWFGRHGVACVWGDDAITIANLGDFRMPIEEARKPGSTDPRNEIIMRAFAMVETGELTHASLWHNRVTGGLPGTWAGRPPRKGTSRGLDDHRVELLQRDRAEKRTHDRVV